MKHATIKKAYAVLGGAFDPIHIGHMRVLIEVSELFPFEKVFFMPYAHSPVGKEPHAPAEERKEMIEIALKELHSPKIGLEEDDLKREGPAYTCDTLAGLRKKYGGECHLSLISGNDVYASLPSWKNWRSLLANANILVINRNGIKNEGSVPAELRAEEEGRLTKADNFMDSICGSVHRTQIPLLEVSSSAIRKKLHAGQDTTYLLPAGVPDYIRAKRLYKGTGTNRNVDADSRSSQAIAGGTGGVDGG